MRAKKHFAELNVMSGIAILFLLSTHAGGSALKVLYPRDGYEQAGLFLRFFSNLVSPAVPLFIFVSGCKFALYD